MSHTDSCCARFSLPLGPQSAKPALSLRWAHQSNLGRTSAQHHPALEPGGANPFCATAVPPRGWSVRAAPTRSGQQLCICLPTDIAPACRCKNCAGMVQLVMTAPLRDTKRQPGPWFESRRVQHSVPLQHTAAQIATLSFTSNRIDNYHHRWTTRRKASPRCLP